jgi:protoheme IX farnesyltransferase
VAFGVLSAAGQLLRPRIGIMAGVSTGIGALLAKADLPTALAAAGAGFLLCAACSVLNQVQERRIDARMARTASRPLASGALAPGWGLALGLALLALAGWVALRMGGLAAALVPPLTALLYNGLYTPLKRVSPHAVLLGAVPGALPPVFGWLLANGPIHPARSPSIWALFAVYYLWQAPHFWTLAERRRDDYARAGLAVAPLALRPGRYPFVHAFWTAAFLLGLAASAVLGVVESGPLRYALLALALISGLAAVADVVPGARQDAAPRGFRLADAAMLAFLGLICLDVLR